ncbi:hypothetical protein SH591_16150 [Sphingomonas sp. LY54]|uniref:hypothetical protein n=1 Tax=Sphingomonas sp. LY54 TaxID=3095343 RepID=UPI002D788EA9|nr:hypothetical protein [Sphingomonas sp. LY54]WRP28592.1 hypothetical protein SH591_16150 [Sphingomonas sp. LY54]
MIKILCVAALALSAAPASANPEPNPSETTQVAPVKEKKICKRKASSLSRLPKQVCKTAAQWNVGAAQGADHSDLQRAGAR